MSSSTKFQNRWVQQFEIEPVDADETEQAIADSHYWVNRGYKRMEELE